MIFAEGEGQQLRTATCLRWLFVDSRTVSSSWGRPRARVPLAESILSASITPSCMT